jgi:aconitate hydratase
MVKGGVRSPREMSTDGLTRAPETLSVGNETAAIYPVERVEGIDPKAYRSRPLVTRILLENLLRTGDPRILDERVLVDLANGRDVPADLELPFRPSRVLMQDFTGIPALVDLASMRDAAVRTGLSPRAINPDIPVELIVDHSVQVDSFRQARSLLINLDREYERNSERYAFLRWARESFQKLLVVPPGNGICHQVNLEYLARVVTVEGPPGRRVAYPDTLLGTDSHTTMVNGLGVLGWGVGGIEAEAVMLGEPYFLAPPQVVGVHLSGQLPEGATATDLVLTVTRTLREKGVVEKFVEFYGDGLESLSVPDRATVSNMCPEYGATAALFPIDDATIAYLRGTGRDPSRVAWVEAYARRQGLWRSRGDPPAEYDERVEIDLTQVVPSMSGPRNPEEQVPLAQVPASFQRALEEYRKAHPAPRKPSPSDSGVRDGAVVIAAITSCTNTSNPSVMIGAGLLARRARERGLSVPSYVKTSFAPGSKVVTEYLSRANLMKPLRELGFEVVGYGCTTCIGNSGPLPPEVEKAVREQDAFVAAVLSGNRNFEARIHNLVRANYLASPMLVVAAALAGRIDLDLSRDPLATDPDGRAVYLRDLWPSAAEVRTLLEGSLDPALYVEKYRTITEGDPHWESLPTSSGETYAWDPRSTYLRNPPYFEAPPPSAPRDGRIVEGARALALFGDNISTDHISPAGEIPPDSPAGQYLQTHGVPPAEFNTYGTRRGNHEVMIRGTFANVRIRNLMVPGKEGGWTRHYPSGEVMTIFEAAQRYRSEGVPLLVLAGARYGQGSSRDWAAKGPRLLGVRAVVAQSYERIHRSNLVGMGILPLQFKAGEGAPSLGLTGEESYTVRLPAGERLRPHGELEIVAERAGSPARTFRVDVRLNSAVEIDYYRQGGLLPYVLRRIRDRVLASA